MRVGAPGRTSAIVGDRVKGRRRSGTDAARARAALRRRLRLSGLVHRAAARPGQSGPGRDRDAARARPAPPLPGVRRRRPARRPGPGLPSEIEGYFQPPRRAPRAGRAPLPVPGGERVKQRAVLRRADAARRCTSTAIDRHSFVIAIGGGAVLDAVGLAAAVTHRGVRLVRVPTTVLAQNDSGVGVKNGINAFGAKNFLGTFAPPFAVINDLDFLTHARAARHARRHGRGGQGRADPRRRVLRLARAARRRAARLRARRAGADDPALRRAPHAPHRPRRRSVRDRQRAAARLRPLGGAQARDADATTTCATARRSRSAWRSTRATRCGRAARGRRGGARSARCSSVSASGSGTRRSSALRPDGSRAVLAGLREFREHLGGELTVTLLRGHRRAASRCTQIDEAQMRAAHRPGSRARRRRHEARRAGSGSRT